ncbi:hypothetical protein D3C81_1796290 [compost metagenome]
MRNAKVHAATPGKDFASYRAFHRIRIAFGLLFGKVDADLHRPAGVHRVEACEQGLAHGHHANEVIENRTQLLFAARGIQPVAVGFAVG